MIVTFAHLLVVAGDPITQGVDVATPAMEALKAVTGVQQLVSSVAMKMGGTLLTIGFIVHFFRTAGDGSFFRGLPSIFAGAVAVVFMMENFGWVVQVARTLGDNMGEAILTEAQYSEYWQSMGTYAAKVSEFSRESAGGGVVGAVAGAVGLWAGGWSTVLLWLSYMVAMLAAWFIGYGRELFLALIMAIGPIALSLTLLGIFNTIGTTAKMLVTGALWKTIACAMWLVNMKTTAALLGLVPDVETNIKLLVLNFFFAFLTIFAAPIGAWLISGQLAAVAGLAASAATAKLMLAGGKLAGMGIAGGVGAAGKGIENGLGAAKGAAKVAGEEFNATKNYIPPRPPDGWSGSTKRGALAGLEQPWYSGDGWSARSRGLSAERAGHKTIMPGAAVKDSDLMRYRKSEQDSPKGNPLDRVLPEDYPVSPRRFDLGTPISGKEWDAISLDDRKSLVGGGEVSLGGILMRRVMPGKVSDSDNARMTPQERGRIASGKSVDLPVTTDDWLAGMKSGKKAHELIGRPPEDEILGAKMAELERKHKPKDEGSTKKES